MFDIFFRRWNNNNASKAEKRSEMTDTNREPESKNYLIEEGLIAADHLEGQPIIIDSLESYDANFDSVEEGIVSTEDTHAEKPGWTLGGNRIGTDDRLPGVVAQGAEVAYVNTLLGVDGDKWNMNSVNALTEYLKSNGLPAQRVTKMLYEKM